MGANGLDDYSKTAEQSIDRFLVVRLDDRDLLAMFRESIDVATIVCLQFVGCAA